MLVKIFRMIRKIFPEKLWKKLQIKGSFFYRCWIRSGISNLGESVFFAKNIKIRGGNRMSIDKNCFINKFCIIEAIEEYATNNNPFMIEIGEGCNFGEFTHISAINSIIIGSGVLTGRFVTITDNSHGNNLKKELSTPPFKRNVVSKGTVKIGDNVWLGDKVTILPNVTIGEGAIIGANSVVTKDIPAFCVAVGIPAKVIKLLI